ncbi:ADP-ribosylglycohydrolase family protein [Inediibacterium massiliense]|uniref:ADP-ribosylglycohydrolase family protein n=1 Tax=Inediibacterium massiliense TaxID=1658111 RepID=UPI0006B4B1BF|nr:ADP-ribosylglycohydrolase family protein [Inediibacterium massiliense]
MIDKIAGTLYGMALGDAMGMPSELWSRRKVKAYFGKIDGFLDGPKENEVACNFIKGQFTDDTSQALILLDSLFANHFKINVYDIAQRMLKWAEKENAFDNNILGPTSKEALLKFKEGKDASIITNNAQTNGAAMRIAPIGCLFDPKQKKELADYVYHISKITHSSDITIAGASMIAMAVSSAFYNNEFKDILQDVFEIESLALRLGNETFNPLLSSRIKLGVQLAHKYKGEDEKFLEEIYNTIGSGVLMSESVPTALSIAYYAQDPVKCSLLCANLGGDTDTIGAMATAICGALKGYKSIDQKYIDQINVSNDINLFHYINTLNEKRGEQH